MTNPLNPDIRIGTKVDSGQVPVQAPATEIKKSEDKKTREFVESQFKAKKEEREAVSDELFDRVQPLNVEGVGAHPKKVAKKNEPLPHVVPYRSDLLTAYSHKAGLHALNVGNALLAVMSRTGEKEEIVMDKVRTEKGKEPSAKRFKTMISSLKNTVNDKSIDLSNADDLALLNGISDLLKKALSAGKGGIGSFKLENDWRSEWDQLSFKAENGPAVNQENQKKLTALLDYLSQETDHHFSTDPNLQHHAKLELNILQMDAVVGQFINDFLLNPGLKSRGKLKEHFIRDGIVSKNFSEVEHLQAALRGNPLLSETKSTKLYEAARKPIAQYIEKKLEELNEKRELPIDADRLKFLKREILEELDRESKPRDVKSSARGRTQEIGGKHSLEFTRSLRGPAGKAEMFYDMPDSADNEPALKMGLRQVKGKEVDSFEKQLKDITKHGSSPEVILRLGFSLESHVKKLVQNPEKRMENVLNKLKDHSEILPDEKELLDELFNSVMNDKDELKNQVGGVVVKYNDNNPKLEMPLAELATLPSIASIMHKNDLRTICSISGTTTDICLGLAAQLGTNELHEVLAPLLEHAKALKKSADEGIDISKEKIDFPHSIEFKEIFTRITFFMQSGKYHTAAEVLGGLFIGVLATGKGEESPEEIFEMFELLMQDFSSHPESYFPLSEEDKAALFNLETQRTEKKELQQLSVTRARENIKIAVQQGIMHKDEVQLLEEISEEIEEVIDLADQRTIDEIKGRIAKAEKHLQRIRDQMSTKAIIRGTKKGRQKKSSVKTELVQNFEQRLGALRKDLEEREKVEKAKKIS